MATTFAEESQALTFELRLDEDQEITISATLDPSGFLDVHSENNSAEIVIPQVIMTAQDDPDTSVESPDDNAEENPGTADATDGVASGGNAGIQSSGGGSLWLMEWIVALLVFGSGRAGMRRHFHT